MWKESGDSFISVIAPDYCVDNNAVSMAVLNSYCGGLAFTNYCSLHQSAPAFVCPESCSAEFSATDGDCAHAPSTYSRVRH